MAQIFAQHADAGKYQLHSAYVKEQENPWNWFVIATATRETPFSGSAKTLEAAKKSAVARIWLAEANWKDVLPAIDLPD